MDPLGRGVLAFNKDEEIWNGTVKSFECEDFVLRFDSQRKTLADTSFLPFDLLAIWSVDTIITDIHNTQSGKTHKYQTQTNYTMIRDSYTL